MEWLNTVLQPYNGGSLCSVIENVLWLLILYKRHFLHSLVCVWSNNNRVNETPVCGWPNCGALLWSDHLRPIVLSRYTWSATTWLWLRILKVMKSLAENCAQCFYAEATGTHLLNENLSILFHPNRPEPALKTF